MKIPPRSLTTAVASLALVFGACSGGDSHEQIVDEISSQMDRMATVTSSVVDKPSAEKAVTDMKSIVEGMKRIAARATALSSPSSELRAKLAARMKAKEADLQQRLAGSQATLAKAGPEAAGIIMKGLSELATAMDEVSDLFNEAEKK